MMEKLLLKLINPIFLVFIALLKNKNITEKKFRNLYYLSLLLKNLLIYYLDKDSNTYYFFIPLQLEKNKNEQKQ